MTIMRLCLWITVLACEALYVARCQILKRETLGNTERPRRVYPLWRSIKQQRDELTRQKISTDTLTTVAVSHSNMAIISKEPDDSILNAPDPGELKINQSTTEIISTSEGTTIDKMEVLLNLTNYATEETGSSTTIMLSSPHDWHSILAHSSSRQMKPQTSEDVMSSSSTLSGSTDMISDVMYSLKDSDEFRDNLLSSEWNFDPYETPVEAITGSSNTPESFNAGLPGASVNSDTFDHSISVVTVLPSVTTLETLPLEPEFTDVLPGAHNEATTTVTMVEMETVYHDNAQSISTTMTPSRVEASSEVSLETDMLTPGATSLMADLIKPANLASLTSEQAPQATTPFVTLSESKKEEQKHIVVETDANEFGVDPNGAPTLPLITSTTSPNQGISVNGEDKVNSENTNSRPMESHTVTEACSIEPSTHSEELLTTVPLKRSDAIYTDAPSTQVNEDDVQIPSYLTTYDPLGKLILPESSKDNVSVAVRVVSEVTDSDKSTAGTGEKEELPIPSVGKDGFDTKNDEITRLQTSSEVIYPHESTSSSITQKPIMLVSEPVEIKTSLLLTPLISETDIDRVDKKDAAAASTDANIAKVIVLGTTVATVDHNMKTGDHETSFTVPEWLTSSPHDKTTDPDLSSSLKENVLRVSPSSASTDKVPHYETKHICSTEMKEHASTSSPAQPSSLRAASEGIITGSYYSGKRVTGTENDSERPIFTMAQILPTIPSDMRSTIEAFGTVEQTSIEPAKVQQPSTFPIASIAITGRSDAAADIVRGYFTTTPTTTRFTLPDNLDTMKPTQPERPLAASVQSEPYTESVLSPVIRKVIATDSVLRVLQEEYTRSEKIASMFPTSSLHLASTVTTGASQDTASSVQFVTRATPMVRTEGHWDPVKKASFNGNENHRVLPVIRGNLISKAQREQEIRKFGFSRGLTVGLVMLAVLVVFVSIVVLFFVVWRRHNSRKREGHASLVDRFEAPTDSEMERACFSAGLPRRPSEELDFQNVERARSIRAQSRSARVHALKAPPENMSESQMRHIMRRRQQQQQRRARLLANDAVLVGEHAGLKCRLQCVGEERYCLDASIPDPVILIGAWRRHNSMNSGNSGSVGIAMDRYTAVDDCQDARSNSDGLGSRGTRDSIRSSLTASRGNISGSSPRNHGGVWTHIEET
ncbi:unnamed protein product [Dicrocoelium dendriticum]|nr:unnamed protein product [Dicrocoelium dendriticum]